MDAVRVEMLYGLLENCRQRVTAATRELADARQLRDSAIAELAAAGHTHTDIARHAGVTRVRVSDIAREAAR